VGVVPQGAQGGARGGAEEQAQQDLGSVKGAMKQTASFLKVPAALPCDYTLIQQ
jgi:hypothetical protein